MFVFPVFCCCCVFRLVVFVVVIWGVVVVVAVVVVVLGGVFLNCCFNQYFMRVLTRRDSLSCMEALQGIYFRQYPSKPSTFMLTVTDVPLLLPLSGCHHFQDSVTSKVGWGGAGRCGAGSSFPLKVVLVGNCGKAV